MKKVIILLIQIVLIFTACNKEEEQKPTQLTVPSPVINSISNEMCSYGDTITIQGHNFIYPNTTTKVRVFNKTYDVIPISNTKISFVVKDDLQPNQNILNVLVSDKVSNNMNFYLIPDYWVYIYHGPNINFIKTFVFDDSSDLISLVNYASNSSYRYVKKLIGNSNGFTLNNIALINNNLVLDLKMTDKNHGVINSSYGAYSTNSGFNSVNFIYNMNTIYYGYYPEIMTDNPRDMIAYTDGTSHYITDTWGCHLHTSDNGLNVSFTTQSPYLGVSQTYNVGTARVKTIGRGSDNYFYEIGLLLRNPFKSFIRKSADFHNWEVLDTISTDYGIKYSSKFYDYNLVLSKNGNQQLIKTTDMYQTTSIVKNDVKNFFIENQNNWYAIGINDKLYSTNDAGLTWIEELQLPINSVVSHMSFSEHKAILCGLNGLLYIKHK